MTTRFTTFSTRAGTGALIALGALGFAAVARANTSDHKPWNWEDEERHRTTDDSSSTCHAMNARMASHITCKIDHASFDAHLANELKKPKISDRDPNSPAEYCGPVAWNTLAGLETMASTQDAHSCPACADELKRRVKTLACVFREGDGEGSVTLDGTTLTVWVTRKTINYGTSGWVYEATLKIFKSWADYAKEHS
ncbi:MAG TPA: hypothetical protein VGL61_28715 [Kofleriaceae bacterium]|jgi:hypothetical protein